MPSFPFEFRVCHVVGESCESLLPPPVELSASLLPVFERAYEQLKTHALWPPLEGPLLVVLDPPESLTQAASAHLDGATLGLPDAAGRPVLIGHRHAFEATDVLIHELSHLYFRHDRGPQVRWQIDGEVCSHQGAFIHEALADVVAAFLTQDALIGEELTGPAFARQLHLPRTCPQDLIGQPHQDSLILSSALWALRQQHPEQTPALLQALAALNPKVTHKPLSNGDQPAPSPFDTLSSFHQTFRLALQTHAPELLPTWKALAETHNLEDCNFALSLPVGTTLSARSDAFLVPGSVHHPDEPPLWGPLRFNTPLPARPEAQKLTLYLRPSHPEPPLRLRVTMIHPTDAPQTTELTLEGFPMASAQFELPPHIERLQLQLQNTHLYDRTANDLRVVLHPLPASTSSLLGCGWGWLGLDALLIAFVCWRVLR